MAERVGIRFTSSVPLFFEQVGVEQFGEFLPACASPHTDRSEMSVIAVSECRSKASRLETAFRSRVSQGE